MAFVAENHKMLTQRAKEKCLATWQRAGGLQGCHAGSGQRLWKIQLDIDKVIPNFLCKTEDLELKHL